MSAREDRTIGMEAGVDFSFQGAESCAVGRVIGQDQRRTVTVRNTFIHVASIDDNEALPMTRRRSSPARSKRSAAGESLGIAEVADESDGYTSDEQACPEVDLDSDDIVLAGEACNTSRRRNRKVSVRNTFITVEDEEPKKDQTMKRAHSWHINMFDPIIDSGAINGSDHCLESQPSISMDASHDEGISRTNAQKDDNIFVARSERSMCLKSRDRDALLHDITSVVARNDGNLGTCKAMLEADVFNVNSSIEAPVDKAACITKEINRTHESSAQPSRGAYPSDKPARLSGCYTDFDVVATLADHSGSDDSAKQVARPAYQARRPAALVRTSSPECHSEFSTPGTCSTDTSSTHANVVSWNRGALLTSSLVRTSSPEKDSAMSETMTDLQHNTVAFPSVASIGRGRNDFAKTVPHNFEAVVGCAYVQREPRNMVVPFIGIPCAPVVQPLVAMSANASADVPSVLVDTAHDRQQPTSTMLNLLPSIGSAGHHRNSCKPCAFGREKCRNGANCEFCHICKPIEKLKRGRWILKRRKQADELRIDLLNLQCGMQQVQHST